MNSTTPEIITTRIGTSILAAMMSAPFALETIFCHALPPGSTEYSALRAEVTAEHYDALRIDEYAIRYVFDFKPPDRCQDWLFCRSGMVGLKSELSDKRQGEAWLVDARKLEYYVPDSGVHAERVSILGRRFGTLLREPGELHFIP